MDGVCVDFMSAVITANGLDADGVLCQWAERHRGDLFPEQLLGKPAAEFFSHRAMDEPDFWSTLRPYDWFPHLFDELSRVGHVVFLTAPTGAPGCVAGKLAWLNKQFGSDFRDFIFTTHKNRLAHDGAFLVDDLDHNIDSFQSRAGNGILFPQIWNQNAHVEDRIGYVASVLQASTGV